MTIASLLPRHGRLTLIADLKSSDKESNNESSHGSDIDIQEECQGKN